MICEGCKNNIGEHTVFPVHCFCGYVNRSIGHVATSSIPPIIPILRTVYPSNNHATICRTNACGYYNKANDTCQRIIDLAALKGQTKAGYISYIETHPETNCPAEVPQWPDMEKT